MTYLKIQRSPAPIAAPFCSSMRSTIVRRACRPETARPIIEEIETLSCSIISSKWNDWKIVKMKQKGKTGARVANPHEPATQECAASDVAQNNEPHPAERAQIEKARKRTKARTPRIAMHIEDRGTGVPALYPDHSDEEGHRDRLADAFGTRSMQFVHSMLRGLGNATGDHSLNLDFSPASPDQLAFNAALAVIDGVRPKDEIEAMLAAQMAVTNIALLELVARTRGSIAGHRYEGNGIKRLDVLGNLTTKFMRTFTLQVEALARKRRKGEQKITVKHVHVYAGGQAVVGNISHRGGRGTPKK